MTMKSLATANSLQAKLHRPKVSFKVANHVNEDEDDDENMALARGSDPLPIVELKPFVQKVWRREKSFVNSWDRSPSVATEKSEKSEHTRVTTGSRNKDSDFTSSVTLDIGLDEGTSPSPPPRTSHSLPSRLFGGRLQTFYVNAFDDFKSQKEHFNKFVGESGFRPKSRLHPVVDAKTKKQAEHSVSIIPGFITREDRTKTTLLEISEGESTSRFFSCSPKAIGPEEIRKQQQIRICGETVSQFKRSGSQYSPTPTKSLNNSWHGPSIRHGSPASVLYHHHKNDDRVKRTKTPLYDYLDRTGALPSLSINATSLKRKSLKKADDLHSEDYTDYRDAFESELKHNIGGIENSLLVLSKHGVPTKVERQISFELEKNLSRYRKLKDYSPFEINPSELAKYYPSPTFNMTQGEMYIRQAMQSNASRRSQKKLRQAGNSKEVSSYHSGYSSETQGSHFIPGILKKSFNEIEHIDSFENVYNPYTKLSNVTFTSNEEPSAPFDTPRSNVESRSHDNQTEVQTKTQTAIDEVKQVLVAQETESAIRANENVAEDLVEVADTETQTSLTPISDKVKKETVDKKDIQSETEIDVSKANKRDINKEEVTTGTIAKQSKTIDVTDLQMKTAQPHPTQTDVSGRTFITTDDVLQVSVVSS